MPDGNCRWSGTRTRFKKVFDRSPSSDGFDDDVQFVMQGLVDLTVLDIEIVLSLQR